MIYPPRCMACGMVIQNTAGLCGECWRDTHFITGPVCDACGLPLPGAETVEQEYCDSCLHSPPVWQQGRAVMLYQGSGRRLVLALKHGDRLDIVAQLSGWLLQAGQDLICENSVIAPVPLHWRRLLQRRYNQAAALSTALTRLSGLKHKADLLIRHRATPRQKGMSRAERRDNLAGAIGVKPCYRNKMQDSEVVLIDDVMTSGATLSCCAEACYAHGASKVNTLVLARVERAD